MKEYLGLCLQGQKSIPERKKMLDEKKRALLSLIQELDDCVAYIDWKQDFYDKVVSGQIPYVSNLIPAGFGAERS